MGDNYVTCRVCGDRVSYLADFNLRGDCCDKCAKKRELPPPIPVPKAVEEFVGQAMEQLKEADNFDLFADRVESLVERWKRFHKRHPNVAPQNCIQFCLAEINDEFTKQLIES